MFILKIKFKGDKVYIKVSGGSVFSIPKNGVYELDIYEGMENSLKKDIKKDL